MPHGWNNHKFDYLCETILVEAAFLYLIRSDFLFDFHSSTSTQNKKRLKILALRVTADAIGLSEWSVNPGDRFSIIYR